MVDRIISAFDEKNWVILCAQMQSGKTSMYTKVIETMGRKAYVISALSDNYLRDQTKERVSHVANVLFLPDIIRKVKEGTMASLITEFHESLIVIDESHVGIGHGGILHRFLSMIGIAPDGYIDINMYPDGGEPIILSVSATPYAEVSCAGDLKTIINCEPGEGYHGLDKMTLIHDGDLADAIAQVRDTKTYAIIRDTCRDLPLLSVVKELGVPIIYCNMETKIPVSDVVEKEPDEFTVIMIKMYSRCGYTFSKEYVSMVWDCLRATSGQAQGLAGRCCGYNTSGTGVTIYCDASIRQHMEWVKSGYDISMVPTVPGKSMYHLPDIDIDDTLVIHMHEPYDDDVIPLIYGTSGLAITSEEDDVDEVIEDVANAILATGSWSFYLSPRYEHLYPYIEDRLSLDIPLYTPSNQEEVANMILERIVPVHIADVEGEPMASFCWPYRRTLTNYIINTKMDLFEVSIDGIVVYR